MTPGDLLSELPAPRGPGAVSVYAVGGTRGTGRPPAGTEVFDLEGEHPERSPAGEREAPRALVAVVVPSVVHLRALVHRAGALPSCAHVAVLVGALSEHLCPPLPRLGENREWPELLDFHGRALPGQGWLVEFFFAEPVPVSEVVAGVARGAVGGRRGAAPLPVGEAFGPDAGMWRPGEPRGWCSEPLEVALETGAAGEGEERGAGHTATVRKAGLGDVSWAALGRPGALADGLPSLSMGDVPPVDERVVNPVGFVRGCSSVVGRLVCRDGRWVLVAGGRERWRVPDDGTVSDADVAAVRDLRAVRVEWGRHSGPLAAVRAVAALAVAGVPLVSWGVVPVWAGCLGGALVGLMGSVSVADLADAQVREEHSVRLRRAGLGSHSVAARWRGLAVEAGAGSVPVASVSVVLCTRRPEMVGFALRQVGRQRGVDVEVVLALHGFGVGAPGVAGAVGAFRASGGRVVVWEAPGDLVFGAVLNGAVERASCPLVAKMDDDDWYGPDHLSDLVAARGYSGADLVGTAPEYFYLEPLSLTVRWDTPSECFTKHVSGACLLTDRVLLEEIGGFRPLPVNEDAALLDGVRAVGASTYRTHGLGHVIRRAGLGHTWLERTGFFLRDKGGQSQGWRPSALLESDPGDEPSGAARDTAAGAPGQGTPSCQSTSS